MRACGTIECCLLDILYNRAMLWCKKVQLQYEMLKVVLQATISCTSAISLERSPGHVLFRLTSLLEESERASVALLLLSLSLP